MSIEAVLFDLDDTLLGNNMDDFLSAYFALISAFVKDIIPPEKFINELIVGTQAMIQNTDHERTNSDVFWEVFCERTEIERADFEQVVSRFYDQDFPKLKEMTHRKGTAREIVEYCFDQGKKVAIATNPLFPMTAINQRLNWAGVPADEFDYSIVTSYESMHSAKPQATYYEEILEVVGVEAGSALMVGDDWENDMIPASSLGLRTFWIASEDRADPEDYSKINGSGTLEDLYRKFTSGWLDS